MFLRGKFYVKTLFRLNMASSSVSQESIDIEDQDVISRRSRIRIIRGRANPGSHKTEYHESMESGDHK